MFLHCLSDDQISLILPELIFTVAKICLLKNWLYLLLNKQRKLKDLGIKIVYIFPQCICNIYYACNFTKSLLLLTYGLLSLLPSFKRSKLLIRTTFLKFNHTHQILILNQRIYVLKWL